MRRWIGFFIAILIGIALGLIYGWVIRPVAYVDTSPDTLRIDYQTDYVLMVAESYQGNNDLQQALRHLALLGEEVPVQLVFEAIQFAEKAGYADADLATMQNFMVALQAYNLSQETPAP